MIQSESGSLFSPEFTELPLFSVLTSWSLKLHQLVSEKALKDSASTSSSTSNNGADNGNDNGNGNGNSNGNGNGSSASVNSRSEAAIGSDGATQPDEDDEVQMVS